MPKPPSMAPRRDEDGNVIPDEVYGTPGVVLEISRGRARVMYVVRGATPLTIGAKFTREAIWVKCSQLTKRTKIEGEDDYFFVDLGKEAIDDEVVTGEEWEDDDAIDSDD